MMDLLKALAETRQAVKFPAPDRLPKAFGPFLHAYPPTLHQLDIASRAQERAISAESERGNNGEPLSATLAAGVAAERGQAARMATLVSNCVHYEDSSGELRPLGEDVVQAMDAGLVAELADALEETQHRLDPPVEAMRDEDFVALAAALKKKDANSQIDGYLKSIGITTLRSFVRTLAKGPLMSEIVSSFASSRWKKRSARKPEEAN